MLITKSQILDLKPCQDRIENLLQFYPKFNSVTLEVFLSMDDISYSDKIWVLSRICTKQILVKWAIACAYSTLYIFETQYPEDKRPRKVLDFLNKFQDPSVLTSKDLETLRSLRNDTYAANAAAATYAANAAAAAYYAANAAYYATYAATYAYAATTATTATTATYASNRSEQEDLNLILLCNLIQESEG